VIAKTQPCPHRQEQALASPVALTGHTSEMHGDFPSNPQPQTYVYTIGPRIEVLAASRQYQGRVVTLRFPHRARSLLSHEQMPGPRSRTTFWKPALGGVWGQETWKWRRGVYWV